MYEELVKRLRRCEQFRCRECEYEQVMGCRAKLNAEAADAIEEMIPFEEQVKKGMGLLDKADELLKAVKPRWIPVTERLPEEAGKYLVCGRWRGKQTEIWVCEFMALGRLGWANNAANPPVTYWIPLPESPKEET